MPLITRAVRRHLLRTHFHIPSPSDAIQVCEICNAHRTSSRDREAKPRAQGTIWLQTAQISENATGKAGRELAGHDRHKSLRQAQLIAVKGTCFSANLERQGEPSLAFHSLRNKTQVDDGNQSFGMPHISRKHFYWVSDFSECTSWQTLIYIFASVPKINYQTQEHPWKRSEETLCRQLWLF